MGMYTYTISVVYHGVDKSEFSYTKEKGPYFGAWLDKETPQKICDRLMQEGKVLYAWVNTEYSMG